MSTDITSTQDLQQQQRQQAPRPSRMPVLFLSHGGPNLLSDEEYPLDRGVGKGLREIGTYIRNLKPRAILIASAHWQAEPEVIHVNQQQITPLIYDFYGFPDEYYSQTFNHVGSPELARQVVETLGRDGIMARAVNRGMDHGAWVVLKKAGLENAGFPIVEMSIFRSDDMQRHIDLGRALASLREQGVLIIGSGMAVHNLRDMWGISQVPDYVPAFDKHLDEIVLHTRVGDNGLAVARAEAAVRLAESPILRKAHPSIEHLLPIHIAIGAAGDSPARKIAEKYELSLSWSCYEFQ